MVVFAAIGAIEFPSSELTANPELIYKRALSHAGFTGYQKDGVPALLPPQAMMIEPRQFGAPADKTGSPELINGRLDISRCQSGIVPQDLL